MELASLPTGLGNLGGAVPTGAAPSAGAPAGVPAAPSVSFEELLKQLTIACACGPVLTAAPTPTIVPTPAAGFENIPSAAPPVESLPSFQQASLPTGAPKQQAVAEPNGNQAIVDGLHPGQPVPASADAPLPERSAAPNPVPQSDEAPAPPVLQNGVQATFPPLGVKPAPDGEAMLIRSDLKPLHPDATVAPVQPVPLAEFEKQVDSADPSPGDSQAQAALPGDVSVVRGGVSDNAPQHVQRDSGPVDQIHDAVLSQRPELDQSGRAEIRLHLNPPHLGRVQIHLSGDGNHLTGRLVVDEQAAYHLLETQWQGMRQRLEEAGITLGKFEVAWNGAGQSGNRHEPQAPYEGRAWNGPRGGFVPRPTSRTEAPRGLVDLLA
jgi:hypothetical protein